MNTFTCALALESDPGQAWRPLDIHPYDPLVERIRCDPCRSEPAPTTFFSQKLDEMTLIKISKHGNRKEYPDTTLDRRLFLPKSADPIGPSSSLHTIGIGGTIRGQRIHLG